MSRTWPPQGDDAPEFEAPMDVVCPHPVECSYIQATAALCGFPEFVASTPPEKYLRVTATGIITTTHYYPVETQGECDGPVLYSELMTFGGSCVYNGASTPADCAVPDGDLYRILTDSEGEETNQSLGCTPDIPGFIDTLAVDVVLTATQKKMTGTADCHENIGNYAVTDRMTGEATSTLSEKDTEANAVARYKVAGTWSDFAPLDLSSCVAAYQQRTGFSFFHREVKWRVRRVFLKPSTAYTVAMKIERRAYGTSDPFVLYATQTEAGTTDASGFLSVEQLIPNDPGFESIAVDPAVVTEV